MRKTLALLLSLAAHPAAAEDVGDWIKRRCARDWPTDYSMQLYCIRQQVEAAQEFRQLAGGEAASGELRSVLATCLQQWGGNAEEADWPMISYCYKQQRQAWSTLKEF